MRILWYIAHAHTVLFNHTWDPPEGGARKPMNPSSLRTAPETASTGKHISGSTRTTKLKPCVSTRAHSYVQQWTNQLQTFVLARARPNMYVYRCVHMHVTCCTCIDYIVAIAFIMCVCVCCGVVLSACVGNWTRVAKSQEHLPFAYQNSYMC